MKRPIMVVVAAVAVSLLLTGIQGAPLLAAEQQSAEELAKKVQNPVADLISVPFQNNFNFDVGPEDDLQYVLNIQPVIPIHLSDRLEPDHPHDRADYLPAGLYVRSGPRQRSRRHPVHGVPVTGEIRGPDMGCRSDRAVSDKHRRPIGQRSLGSRGIRGRAENVEGQPLGLWRSYQQRVVGGRFRQRPELQQFPDPAVPQLQFPRWDIPPSSPIITANWKADSGDCWTVPLGGGAGKIVRFGRLPVNLQLQAYYNVVTPDNGADWQLRFQVQFLFPK